MIRLFFGTYFSLFLLLVGARFFDATFNAWVIANVLVYPLVALASIAVHEGAHAAAALLLGMTVPRIELGVGRRVAAWKWVGTAIRLNSWPLAGFTYPSVQSTRALKLRFWLVTAAGPLATFALMRGAVSAELGFWRSTFPAVQVAQSFALLELFAYFNWLLLLTNLWPFRWRPGAGHITDGERLLTLPFQRRERLEDAMNTATLLEADELREAGRYDEAQLLVTRALSNAPRSFVFRNMIGALHLDRGAPLSARTVFRQLASEPPTTALAHLLVRNNLAWADFQIRSDDLKEEADCHSAEVLQVVPHAPWALGTRGAVLMWLGRHDEARPMLQRAYLFNAGAQERAMNACVLAMLEASSGRIKDARVALGNARSENTQCALLAEAEQAVATAAASAVTSQAS